MDEILFEYMEKNINGELFDLYRRAGGIIEHFDFQGNYSPLVDMIHRADMTDEMTINLTIHAVFDETLSLILKEFLVTATENATLKDKCDIVEAILMVEDTGEVDTALSIIQSFNEDPEDCLCELFTLVTSHPSDHWTQLIHRVSPALINRMYEELSKVHQEHINLIEEESDDEKEQVIIKNMMMFLKRYTTNPPILKDNPGDIVIRSYPLVFFSSISPMMVNFEEMMTILDGDVISDDLEVTSFNLYLVAAMSKDGCMDPYNFISKQIENYFPDINESKQVLEYIRIVKSNLLVGGKR